jgi:hypothetical protein
LLKNLEKKIDNFTYGEVFENDAPRSSRPSRSTTQYRISYNEDLLSPNLEGDDGDAHPSTFPCANFLRDAGILDDFLLLVNRVGIDLHLGQKPKLGGRYAGDSLIYILYFIGPLYIHVSLSLLFSLLFLLSKTQKDQKYFHCFSLFISLAFYLWFSLLAIFGLKFEKSKNISLCLLFPSVLVSKIEKPKNICCSSSVL